MERIADPPYRSRCATHRVSVRRRCRETDTNLDGYGLFRLDDGARVIVETEHDAEAALQPWWIRSHGGADPNQVGLTDRGLVPMEV